MTEKTGDTGTGSTPGVQATSRRSPIRRPPCPASYLAGGFGHEVENPVHVAEGRPRGMHIEVQGKKETNVGRRMYGYNTRLFAHHNRLVVRLAVLTDEWAEWWPIAGEKRMPYVSRFERHALERGERQGFLSAIEQALEVRFDKEGLDLFPEIKELQDFKRLKKIHRAILKAVSLEAIRRALRQSNKRLP